MGTPVGRAYSFLLFAVLAGLIVSGCGGSSDPSGGSQDVQDSVAASLLHGSQQAYRNGRFRRALALAGRATDRSPELADAHFLKARIFTRLRRLELADSAYREVANVAPSYKGLWFNWGNLAFREGKYRRALQLYRKEDSPDLQSRVYTNAGRAYSNLSKPDSARIAYQKAIEADSTNTTALGWLSQFHQDGGALEKALVYSRRMVRLNPDDPDYRYMLGSQLVQSGRPREAVSHLRKVLDERRSHHGAHYNLGRALIGLGNTDAANRHLAIADSLENIESKIERQRALTQENPQRPEVWIRLGNTLRKLGRFEEAVDAYQSARTLAPRNALVLNNLANLYLETGDTTGALRQYHDILRMDSTSADTWFNLGVLYANRGQDQKARAAWKNVLKYRPDDAVTRKYLRMLEDS